MRKKYIVKDKGDDRKFWEGNWDRTDIEDAVKFCNISPLRPIFDTYLPKNGKILEGGCGTGHFVIYYKQKGYDIEGVDFAEEAINRARKLYPEIPLKKGDVLHLEYPDNYFKAYYSGGVVEHFEEGPYKALIEARRVLRNEGLLIISVPYFNPFRITNSRININMFGRRHSESSLDFDGIKSLYTLTSVHKRENPPVDGFSFHQYEYTEKEFSDILKACGFQIILTRPVSISWGLMDVAFLRKLFTKAIIDKTYSNDIKQGKAVSLTKRHRVKTFFKRIIVSEDYSYMLTRPILRLLGHNFGNLILFACKVKK